MTLPDIPNQPRVGKMIKILKSLVSKIVDECPSWANDQNVNITAKKDALAHTADAGCNIVFNGWVNTVGHRPFQHEFRITFVIYNKVGNDLWDGDNIVSEAVGLLKMADDVQLALTDYHYELEDSVRGLQFVSLSQVREQAIQGDTFVNSIELTGVGMYWSEDIG